MLMKQEFSNTAPVLRLVFAVAALFVSLSIGVFIDYLATDYVAVADGKQHTLLTAERQPTAR
jgi:hypothetical protein